MTENGSCVINARLAVGGGQVERDAALVRRVRPPEETPFGMHLVTAEGT
jgi:hypothetical protein